MNFILLLLIVIVICSLTSNGENFTTFYLGQPTKCFSCERSLPKAIKYLGGPTKCFSCERDMARRYGLQYSDLGQPSKCFDCERQFGKLPWRR